MDHDEIINEMSDFGFDYNEGYLTHDKCFDYDGCGAYPLVFHGWEQVEAFVRVLNDRFQED